MTEPQAMHNAFVIAGERSGVGKTMITLAMARALMRRGSVVQCFKVGPDFIDPDYHTALTGRVSRNLDAWMTSQKYCRTLFEQASCGAAIVIVEGVMGLFDGYGRASKGSTAQIAQILDLPVILIIDGSSLAQTAGALVMGFRQYDPKLKIAGILFNKVSSKRHYETLRDAVAKAANIPVFGYIPRKDHWKIPHRHLGLVMAGERTELPAAVERCAADIEQTVDLSKVLRATQYTRQKSIAQHGNPETRIWKTAGVRIGVARDEAFCFCYPDNIELLERAGAEIIYFSPLHDEKLSEDLQGLYLPGGYPELHAELLSSNRRMKQDVLLFCQSGRPVYAECGGFLYLLRAIIDANGRQHAMVGLFPATAGMRDRLQRFGYITVTATKNCPFLAPNQTVRGHEFHYSDIHGMPPSVPRTWMVSRRADSTTAYAEGYVLHNVLAGYPHLHFASNPAFAKNFVAACKNATSLVRP